MHGDFPEFQELYEGEGAREFLRQSSLVEAAGYCRWTRLREIGEFATRMGYRRLGVAHGPDMGMHAGKVATALETFGIEGILPPPASSDQEFRPSSQAEFFTQAGAELIVVGGMSVAHEVILIRASTLPVVALVARDTRLAHNPAAALYTSRSYLKSELFGHWPPGERPSFRGWDMNALEEAARLMEVEGEGSRSRVAEAMELAHRLGVSHIGISFCVGFREEARILSKVFKTNGFRVSSVCCKTGSVPKEEAGIRGDEKVRPGRPEMICNPSAQAELLNRDGVELAFVLGQCVGHDAATFQKLEAPSACIVAKDRVLAHNTVAALE
jgi:uncharacterized metal-binding protein